MTVAKRCSSLSGALLPLSNSTKRRSHLLTVTRGTSHLPAAAAAAAAGAGTGPGTRSGRRDPTSAAERRSALDLAAAREQACTLRAMDESDEDIAGGGGGGASDPDPEMDIDDADRAAAEAMDERRRENRAKKLRLASAPSAAAAGKEEKGGAGRRRDHSLKSAKGKALPSRTGTQSSPKVQDFSAFGSSAPEGDDGSGCDYGESHRV